MKDLGKRNLQTLSMFNSSDSVKKNIQLLPKSKAKRVDIIST
jgi:hypothetical protein